MSLHLHHCQREQNLAHRLEVVFPFIGLAAVLQASPELSTCTHSAGGGEEPWGPGLSDHGDSIPLWCKAEVLPLCRGSVESSV